MKIKYFCIYISLSLMLIISSCQKPYDIKNTTANIGNALSETAEEIQTTDELTRPQRENMSIYFKQKNTVDYGFSCVLNNTIYYSSGFGEILRYIDPITGFSENLCKDPLCDHNPQAACLANMEYLSPEFIITDDEYIYVYAKRFLIHENFDERKAGIYRIDVKNSSLKTLYEWDDFSGRYISTIRLQGDYIYFTKRDGKENNNTLYKLNKDGGKPEKLNKKDVEFQNFEIHGEKIYYRTLDNTICESDFSMQNPKLIAQKAMTFTIKNGYMYTSNEILQNLIGEYHSSSYAFKYEIRKINLNDITDDTYLCTSLNIMPIFDDDYYYYLPYEPVNTAKHTVDGREYDLCNLCNGKIIVADIKTNEIKNTYQNVSYFAIDLYYADGEVFMVKAGDAESGEYFNYICKADGENLDYYGVYENPKTGVVGMY